MFGPSLIYRKDSLTTVLIEEGPSLSIWLMSFDKNWIRGAEPEISTQRPLLEMWSFLLLCHVHYEIMWAVLLWFRWKDLGGISIRLIVDLVFDTRSIYLDGRALFFKNQYFVIQGKNTIALFFNTLIFSSIFNNLFY